MDEIWERAVETALDGQADCSSARSLTLDGAVKCVHGRLPPPGLLEKFQNLEHLSIANVGVSSLEKFPRLRKLQKLILSDNRIAGGLEFLVEAGLESLRDLDLSNNRIQYLDDLAPLAQLRLVSLDLYECPVTRVKDYRSRVFNMIKSLKYLDKMDADENETPESDDDDDDDDDEDDDDEDPGTGEVDGEDQSVKMVNGGSTIGGVVDEDELSDADEEETETSRSIGNGLAGVSSHLSNGFHVLASTDGDDDEYDVDDEDDDDLGEEIDEEDDDVVEVHEIEESDEEEDRVEEEDDDDDDDDEDADEDVEDEEEGAGLSRVEQTTNTEGEIDGHDHGEEGDDDENGEIGEEEEHELEEGGYYEEDEGDEEEEDFGSEYLVQPVMQAEDIEGSDVDLCNEDDGEEDDVEEDVQNILGLSSSSIQKRKRDVGGDDDEDDYLRSIKRH